MLKHIGTELAETMPEAHATDKPVLTALCGDIRFAANQLPACSSKRLLLLDLLVAFSKTLASSDSKDITEAQADAFRNDHTIPKRLA